MKHAAAKTTTPGEPKPAAPLSGMTIAIQLMDTTWRVALPIIILSLIGIRLDRHYHHKILFTIGSLLVSLLVSSLLIYRQIQTVYPDFFRKRAKK